MQPVPESIVDAIACLDLPSMPQVLLRLLRLSDNPSISAAELAEIVQQDPALSVHVLVAANQASGRQAVGLSTVRQCVGALGPRIVRTMAACLAIRGVFDRSGGQRGLDLTGYWVHSLHVAELARGIASELGREDGDEAYLAGLLHDVGQLLLLGGMDGRYGTLLAWSRDEEALLALERPELGTDHAAVGAWLIDQWRLPSFMADAVLFHHCQPTEIPAADALSRIVWTAHAVVGTGLNEERFEHRIMESMLGLTDSSLAALRGQALARVAQLTAELGIEAAAQTTSVPRPSHPPLDNAGQSGDRVANEGIDAVVRDMAVMAPLHHNLSEIHDEIEFLGAVRQAARILFGLGQPAFLLTREDGLVLTGAGVDGQPPLLQSFGIPLDEARSLLAAVALGEAPRVTFNASPAVGASLTDLQIARAIGSDGVLYLPMASGDRRIGVMAFGVSAAQLGRWEKQLDWMASFAKLVATSLESRRGARDREQRRELELTSRFEQRARQVAHEAGNPLSIITNYLKIVSDRLPESAGVHHELEILKEEIDRVAKIIRRLGDKSLAAPEEGGADVNAVIEGMAALYRESLFSSRGITLDLILNEQLPAIPGSRDQIKQILLNLWKNASEAVPSGGRLVVSTANGLRQGNRDYVEIRLADTGPGLPAEVIENIFQPLDPGRRPGHAGMGLSIVAALVKGLDGQITFQSRAGQGTTFVILLPKSERSAQ